MSAVRDTATVTVTDAVDGQPKRRGPGKRKRQQVTVITVDPVIMAAAQQIMTPHQRLIPESATSVVLWNKGNGWPPRGRKD